MGIYRVSPLGSFVLRTETVGKRSLLFSRLGSLVPEIKRLGESALKSSIDAWVLYEIRYDPLVPGGCCTSERTETALRRGESEGFCASD